MSASLHIQTGSITQSYYSSPKHKSPLHRYLIHFSDFHKYNLEHGLAIVTESFSPLNRDHTTCFVKVQIRSDAISLDAVDLLCTHNWVKSV